MTIQVLVAAVKKNVRGLVTEMNLNTDAIIINQDDYFSYEEFQHNQALIKAYTFAERGVGLSRNHALLRANGDIVLFSDDDIVLEDDYADVIRDAFTAHPQADLMIFNVAVDERRATYRNTAFKRVRWYNYGRYPTYSVAARTERLHFHNISFSVLFGGGAKYSSGEDSLFLHDCLKKGLKVYSSPKYIGREVYRESTWFTGYTEKFFYDRGVIYRLLYGMMAKPFALRFLYAKKAEMCREISFKQAYQLMKKGIHS